MDAVGFSYCLGTYHDAVISALEALSQKDIITRIWAKDYTVWKPAPDEIVNRLGWLDAPAEMLLRIQNIRAILEPLISSDIKDVVLLGMGGSSLAAEVFSKIFGCRPGYPRLRILDTTDPALIAGTARNLELKKTVFLVSSKSGTTLETTSLFYYFYNLVSEEIGADAGNHFILITDQDSPLVKIARELSLQHIFLSNPAIGGRYSALSMPGIVPAIIVGVDVERLLQNAASAMLREKTQSISGKLNAPGACLGAVLGTLAQMGRDKLTFIMVPQWKSFGDWLEQLIAESTGKEGKGILPVLDEPISAPDRYRRDRVFVFFNNRHHKRSEDIAALTAAGHPVITVELNDPYDIGAQMFIWEMAIAVAGHILSINPFVQPSVEATKNHTRRMIALLREGKKLPPETPALTTSAYSIYGSNPDSSVESALNDFLQLADGNYISLQVYLSPAKESEEALRQLRTAIFTRCRLPVTIGYGPRYLHSTGQLHKGDAGKGLFIQLTAADSLDMEIPDQPGVTGSALSFSTLKAFQAEADRQALLELGRKVIRIHLQKNIAAGIEAIAGTLTGKY